MHVTKYADLLWDCWFAEKKNTAELVRKNEWLFFLPAPPCGKACNRHYRCKASDPGKLRIGPYLPYLSSALRTRIQAFTLPIVTVALTQAAPHLIRLVHDGKRPGRPSGERVQLLHRWLAGAATALARPWRSSPGGHRACCSTACASSPGAAAMAELAGRPPRLLLHHVCVLSGGRGLGRARREATAFAAPPRMRPLRGPRHWPEARRARHHRSL